MEPQQQNPQINPKAILDHLREIKVLPGADNKTELTLPSGYAAGPTYTKGGRSNLSLSSLAENKRTANPQRSINFDQSNLETICRNGCSAGEISFVIQDNAHYTNKNPLTYGVVSIALLKGKVYITGINYGDGKIYEDMPIDKQGYTRVNAYGIFGVAQQVSHVDLNKDFCPPNLKTRGDRITKHVDPPVRNNTGQVIVKAKSHDLAWRYNYIEDRGIVNVSRFIRDESTVSSVEDRRNKPYLYNETIIPCELIAEQKGKIKICSYDQRVLEIDMYHREKNENPILPKP